MYIIVDTNINFTMYNHVFFVIADTGKIEVIIIKIGHLMPSLEILEKVL